MHPTHLGWQVDWPVFVKRPISADGKNWKAGEHFNWLERGMDEIKVSSLYVTNFIYHNKELEVQNKVGDRLSELNSKQLSTLVGLLNREVKDRTASKNEFEAKKCKMSKIDGKQRGLIRRFLNGNVWVTEIFYELRDQALGE